MSACGRRAKNATNGVQTSEDVRPANPDDLARLTELWRAQVAAGEIDTVPSGAWFDALLRHFDWEARSRVVEEGGHIRAAILVIPRRAGGRTLARLEVTGEAERRAELVDWGRRLAHAAGAEAVQAWRGRGHGRELQSLGFEVVRPFWRMDRPGLDGIPDLPLGAPYQLVSDADAGVPSARWAATYNLAFAEHWQHSPMEVDDVERRRGLADHEPGLQLLAVTPQGVAGALVIASVERYEHDRRAQPVGVVAVVGTVPGHRRRGLAGYLLAESLRRLRAAGAASASLYVDGLNPTGADRVYRRLGFEVGYEMEVWEAALGS